MVDSRWHLQYNGWSLEVVLASSSKWMSEGHLRAVTSPCDLNIFVLACSHFSGSWSSASELWKHIWGPINDHDFLDCDVEVWACVDGSASFQQSTATVRNSCKQTVSNKSSGTYRFGIRDCQQHSVKTPSNPYQDRSQSVNPERIYTNYLSRSTNGWVAGDHSTTVDRL